nr:PREDICTED: coiled-coil domain-containing protein 65 [Megachile rotundata]
MMKRRKRKSDKFARMSEEERARYIQHRAEYELETKRRKQQLIAIFTKNKLKREGVFSKLNDAKINEKWRYILRQTKRTELFEDIKHVCETFERAVNVKNETITCLYKDLKTADVDHRKLHESHTILINNIIGKFKEKLKILHLKELKSQLEQDCKDIYNSIVKKNASSNEKQSTKKIQNAVNILSITYLVEETTSNLMSQSFLKIESLWDQLYKTINEYERITENKRKQYEYLKQQDITHQISIQQYPKTYLQLQNAIENLKCSMEMLSLKRNNYITRLKEKETDMNNKFKNIKYNIASMQMIDSFQMKKLIITSNEVFKYLQRIIEKSSAVLEIVKIYSALESTSFNAKKYFMQNAIHTEFVDTDIPKSYSKINKFWEQYNCIKVDNILLKQKGDKLCAENEKLTQELQTYITTISEVPVLRPIVSPLH